MSPGKPGAACSQSTQPGCGSRKGSLTGRVRERAGDDRCSGARHGSGGGMRSIGSGMALRLLRSGLRLRLGLSVLMLAGFGVSGASGAEAMGASAQLRSLLSQAARAVCGAGPRKPPVPDADLLGSDSFKARDGGGMAYDWRLPGGQLLRVTRLEGAMQRGPLYFVDAYDSRKDSSRRPRLRIVVTEGCQILGGQDVLYEPTDPERPFALQRLGPELKPLRDPNPLNPPVPKAKGDPSCMRVAILDNGVNYLLPSVAPRLARDADGRLVGYDYWEGDDRPMDFGYPPRSLDPRVSPFSPRHHGTGVATIFLAEAPDQACVAPYRYFPADETGASDPRRMVHDMAKVGVKIVNLSSGRDRPWPEFREAMRAHPEMLFVLAAGNGGYDIDRRRTYPASYGEPNAIVVAATDRDGSLWEHSNRGTSVDVAILAVDIPGTLYNGKQKNMTGTSMAAPRVSAFAAQLLAQDPGLDGAALKRRIVERARATGKRAGSIPVLTEEALKRR
jgi:hypothetical protein